MGSGAKRNYRRRQRLIKPAFQLRIIALFLGVSALSVVLQSMLMSRSLTELQAQGMAVASDPQAFSLLRTNMVLTLAILVPSTLILGIVTTHRIAGPIYRFERFLEKVVAGERPRECQLRRRDELQGFCALLNRATAPLRYRDPTEIELGKPDADEAPSLVRDAVPESARPTAS